MSLDERDELDELRTRRDELTDDLRCGGTWLFIWVSGLGDLALRFSALLLFSFSMGWSFTRGDLVWVGMVGERERGEGGREEGGRKERRGFSFTCGSLFLFF